MASRRKSRLKVNRTYFENKNGGKTPILRRKKDETDEAFFERMKARGYVGIDNSPKHWDAASMALHAGSADDCIYCKKRIKTSTDTSSTQDEEGAELKAKSAKPDAPSVSEVKDDEEAEVNQ